MSRTIGVRRRLTAGVGAVLLLVAAVRGFLHDAEAPRAVSVRGERP